MKTLKMNKIIYFVAAMFMISSFWGCENLLDVGSDSKIIENEDIPKNQKDLNALLMGSYGGMRKPLNTEWMLTELRSDNSYQYAQNTAGTVNLELNDIDMFRPMTTNTQVYQYWVDVYQNIKNVNLVLNYIDLVKDEAIKNQYEGEARFIRAYHYYNLVQLYGPLPLVTKYVTTEEAKKINRSPVKDVYAQIIADLKFAAQEQYEKVKTDENGDPVLDENDQPVMVTVAEHLPKKYADEELGRVTHWSAKTLLAKVYLLVSDYPELLPEGAASHYAAAKELLLDIKDNSGHKLMNNYADVFSTINEMTAETIFAIRFTSGAGIGSPFANRFSPASSGDLYIIGDGNSYNYPTQDFLDNAFEDGDLREDVTVDAKVRYVKKHFSKVKLKDDAENDWQVLRYSDVLLLLAEIYNETEGPANAIPYLQAIRERAGLTTMPTISSQNDCRIAIEKERRSEFAFENHRYFDLLRTKRLITVLDKQFFDTERGWYSNYGTGTLGPTFSTVPENKILLPIPQKEIDTSTEFILTQNEGY